MTSISQWLKEKCRKEHLSLRQVAARTGLSHATIADIRKGTRPSPQTVRKLAWSFSESGGHQRLVLEDKLLVLAGYRSERPEGEELSESMAELMDKVREFSEPQIEVMLRFAEFLIEIEGKC